MKESTTQRITALLAAAGPSIREELVFSGEKNEDGTPKDGYKEYGLFSFKRLSFFELDNLRLHSVNFKGQFDPKLHAGNNARIVAATLVDEDGNLSMPVASINLWPGAMVDAFANASNRVNGTAPNAIEDAAKNSEPTPSDEQS